MPLLHETQAAVGNQFERCESRSLVLERFANPGLEKDERRNFFKLGIGKPALSHKRDAWRDFLLRSLDLKSEDLLFAKLQGRLMVNMAGGVMENAGLCLDRLTGIPHIPGSAIKGCARRFAIHTLLETAPDGKPALLVEIALAFGWGDADWKARSDFKSHEQWEKHRSDLAWAGDSETEGHAPSWPRVREQSQQNILTAKGWRSFPSGFAGAVQFLPAYPFGKPPTPDLELDVVTCHHQKYYSQEKDKQGRVLMPVALDTEDPNPVVFPAVAPGHVFAFAVLGEDSALVAKAKSWLKGGLEQFGLGAKTAAGYGWFEEDGQTGGTPMVSLSAKAAPGPSVESPISGEPTRTGEHPLIVQWRGKTEPGNFRVFRPLLVKIEDVEELRRVFIAIMPANELQRLRVNNPYWQSFCAQRDGRTILQRLGITLK